MWGKLNRNGKKKKEKERDSNGNKWAWPKKRITIYDQIATKKKTQEPNETDIDREKEWENERDTHSLLWNVFLLR